MTSYPRANTTRAWYQGKFPGATMKPNVGVLHTTEGTSLPSYSGGATAPTYTAVPNFRAKRLDWFAHFPDEKSARALRNTAGGVETNTLNAIQVELVGTCAPGIHADWKRRGIVHIYWPEAPDWALKDLAEFVAWCHKVHGIKVQGPARWAPYPASITATRFTFAQWRAFYGWCGHQHVPENVHGDPGALPWAKVEKYAKAILGQPTKPGGKPKAPKPTPNWDKMFQGAVGAEKALGKSPAPERRKALAQIKAWARKFSTRY